MEETNQAEIYIEISAADATSEELDHMTRQLLSELRDLNVESAELTTGGPVPEGSKGDPITIGSIIIATLPTVLPAVVTLVQTWSTRGQGRVVKFKGKNFEFEGSPEELLKLLERLERGNKKK